MSRTKIFSALLASAALTPLHAQPPDPNLYLESLSSPQATAWVQAHNAKTLAALRSDPHYQPLYTQALALEQAPNRIPTPEFLGKDIGNFWQDAAHTQGLWRKTSAASYQTPTPAWQTLLDLDALSEAEHHTWVFKGDTCWQPQAKDCLLALSEGGEDAVTTREFQTQDAAIPKNGFLIPHAKQSVDWETPDSLIISTDWGDNALTESGYPFIVKRLHRGQPLARAQEIFRGTPKDVSVNVETLTDGDNHHATVLIRGLDFFRNEFRIVTQAGTRRLNLPEKSDIVGLLNNNLIARINEQAGGIPAGSLVALDLAQEDAAPALIFAPNPRQTVDEFATTAHHLIATINDNVKGQACIFTNTSNAWQQTRISLPDNASIHIDATAIQNDDVFLEAESFLFPNTLYLANATGSAPPEKIKSRPAEFDASNTTTDQFEATSADGTKIPYFVVHPKNFKLDGQNPTLMTAYGGFQISETPRYAPVTGKLWIEPGYTYVLANIRGGGEFGPAWHEAGLRTKRQTIYNDFAAVAQDLIARHITSPAKLAIRGGSNGGLLMGVEFEQHPDLWAATIIDVPLLDMQRYEKIAAGASWVGEYGSNENPQEHAFLEKISPYNNLKEGAHYPTPFIFTTTKDESRWPGPRPQIRGENGGNAPPLLFLRVHRRRPRRRRQPEGKSRGGCAGFHLPDETTPNKVRMFFSEEKEPKRLLLSADLSKQNTDPTRSC